VVDDEESVLRIAKRILASSGYTVLTATGASGAVHLLLTDVVMPTMNGRELALRLRGTFPNLKVIYMSGYTADIIGDHGVIDEGMDFVAKPFSPGELQLAVQEMLSADLKLARLAP
jgi:two-component system cell cycle sensor histidine kinase/response regulator CckA